MISEQNQESDDKNRSPEEDSNAESCLSEDNDEDGELSDGNSSRASESGLQAGENDGEETPSKGKNRKIATLSYEQISQLFHLKQIDAARQLGISLTAMKNMCRRAGIWKWPYSRKRTVTHFQDLSWLIKSHETDSGSASGSSKKMPKTKEQSISPSSQVVPMESSKQVSATSAGTVTVTVSSPQTHTTCTEKKKEALEVASPIQAMSCPPERQGPSMTISDYLHFENVKTLGDYRTIRYERSASPESKATSSSVKQEPASPSADKVLKSSPRTSRSPPDSPTSEAPRIKRQRT
ncbi:hypothetical protein GUITHDRAFT_107994 [Guillardia theta CCMP2712]|uniref:RWP-RK domain-containing protein n=1 Tax=Guillardia theta (strain CCMP2712) TaxID=905079 RepID=L1JCC7_GUITC|nr:hypothetical protein GUITHDRAFT_107994 [Guillardia theta CCMP2712]EKX45957.1 hypothetical protein GUITHDRAFT_107994 [Guillardia theta CCMP2712]|eukprot:XP_005832937.1 hypothetical protein GUITHDRAFT_107994 [Guillardia theta CCMP2712]